jgi:hypothetical protein
MLWVAAILPLTAERLAPGRGMGTLGLVIIGVILLYATFARWQNRRAEQALAARWAQPGPTTWRAGRSRPGRFLRPIKAVAARQLEKRSCGTRLATAFEWDRDEVG